MYIAGILEKEGIKAEILGFNARTQPLVARLKSTAMADLRRRCCWWRTWMWSG